MCGACTVFDAPANRTATVIAVMLVTLIATACTAGRQSPQPDSSEVVIETPPGPSQAQSTDGDWQVMFDGDRVDGLRAYGGTGFPGERWLVGQGRLSTVAGSGVDLISEERFGDFELEFAWAVTPGGNGGVMYRVTETDQPAWTTGPEYQLLDDTVHPDGANPATSAAALYDLLAPNPDKVLARVAEDNLSRIVAVDGAVEHWLNGDLVVEYRWDDPALRETIARSKFSGYAGFMTAPDGHLVFQHHGEAMSYSLIRVRPR
jgi:hypothetical protein